MDDVLAQTAGALVVTRHEGIATISLNRPDKHNAINLAMWQAFGRLLPALAKDSGVDVVVFRGPEGGPFSAGADISEFTTLRSTPKSAEQYGEAVASGEGAILSFPKPTIAMVEGFAIGGGAQVALACDLRLCSPATRFGITPAKLGIVYGLQSTARLVDVVGSAWASYILFTGDLVDAATALRIGLVHEVTDGLEALIAKVATGVREEDDEVRGHYRESLHSPEYAEGVASFLAKRTPDFRGVRTTGQVSD